MKDPSAPNPRPTGTLTQWTRWTGWTRPERTSHDDTGRSAGTALVTGASSGIGEAFARALAGRGHDLILVARRVDRLERLSVELAAQHSIHAQVWPADLTDTSVLADVAERVGRVADLALLVNSAGFGAAGHFAFLAPDRQVAMVSLHVTAPVHLCRAALPQMIVRGSGAIINVASVLAFVPIPGNATYCATKAAMVSFSEALQIDLKGTGVKVQALCPGLTRTEMHGNTDMQGYERGPGSAPTWAWSSAAFVAEASLRSLGRDGVVCVPGRKWQAVVFLARIGVAPWVARRMIRQVTAPPFAGTK